MLRLVHTVRIGLVALASAAAACGPAATPTPAPVTAPGAATAADAPPAMLMLILKPQGPSAVEMPARAGQPVMIMAVSRDTREHRLHAALPLSSLQIQDPGVPAVAPTSSTSGSFDVDLAPGHEVDVMFTPSAPGRYPIDDAGVTVGMLVIGASAS